MGADAPDDAPPRSPATRSSAPPAPDPLIGRFINDRYRVVSLIARGGMGKVYRAEQSPLGREVALKVLNPTYSGENDPEFHRRFFLEASISSKLTHPNTVTIFDYGRTDDDVYYIAMELLEGKTLHRALRESGPAEPARALHIARQVCRSLREAHGLGVIHRDLKPANIYLVRHGDESDFVKVLDFGLVKNVDEKGEDLTQTGLFMGSPKYMSPEQIRGERVDARTDLYALGVMLFEMLTGKVPFDRSSSVNILMAHVHEQAPPMREVNAAVEIPPLLEQIVMKTLSKNPDDRFASMDALLVALKQAGAEIGGSHDALRSGEYAAFNITGRYPAAGRDSLAPPSGANQASLGSSNERPSQMGRDVPSAKWMWLGISALTTAVVISVGVGAMLGRAGSDDTVALPATLPVEEAPREVAPAEPAPAIARTWVALRSTPPGAIVRVHTADGLEHEFGPTPTDIEWASEDAERGREVTFVFVLDGYRDMSVSRRMSGDTLDIDAELEEIETSRPSRPRPRRPDDSEGPVGPVNGYKLDPY